MERRAGRVLFSKFNRVRTARFRRCVRLRRLGVNQKWRGTADEPSGLADSDGQAVHLFSVHDAFTGDFSACPFDCHRLYPDCPALRRCPLPAATRRPVTSDYAVPASDNQRLLLLLLLLASSAAACDPRLLRAGPVDSFEVFEKRFLVFQNPALRRGSMRSLQGSTTSAELRI